MAGSSLLQNHNGQADRQENAESGQAGVWLADGTVIGHRRPITKSYSPTKADSQSSILDQNHNLHQSSNSYNLFAGHIEPVTQNLNFQSIPFRIYQETPYHTVPQTAAYPARGYGYIPVQDVISRSSPQHSRGGSQSTSRESNIWNNESEEKSTLSDAFSDGLKEIIGLSPNFPDTIESTLAFGSNVAASIDDDSDSSTEKEPAHPNKYPVEIQHHESKFCDYRRQQSRSGTKVKQRPVAAYNHVTGQTVKNVQHIKYYQKDLVRICRCGKYAQMDGALIHGRANDCDGYEIHYSQKCKWKAYDDFKTGKRVLIRLCKCYKPM